jgi:hypothetical protein
MWSKLTQKSHNSKFRRAMTLLCWDRTVFSINFQMKSVASVFGCLVTLQRLNSSLVKKSLFQVLCQANNIQPTSKSVFISSVGKVVKEF